VNPGDTGPPGAHRLPLRADVAAALADGTGPPGEVLWVVDACENGEPTGIPRGTVAGQGMDASGRPARAPRRTPV
jgi:hypothetical protein